jgi:hypothetical protein
MKYRAKLSEIRILPLTILLVGFSLVLTFAPEPGRSFIFLFVVFLYLDIAFFMWFYPRWWLADGNIEVIRLWRKQEIPVEDVLAVKRGYYFPLFWIKSFRIEFSDRGRRNYFLAKLAEREGANPEVEELEKLIGKERPGG